MTDRKRIADSRQRTRANRNVIRDCTDRTNATSTRTRILTLSLDASLRFQTVSVGQTFRLTAFIRISAEIWQTFTIRRILSFPAISVDSTRWRTAGFQRCRWFFWSYKIKIQKYWYFISEMIRLMIYVKKFAWSWKVTRVNLQKNKRTLRTVQERE